MAHIRGPVGIKQNKIKDALEHLYQSIRQLDADPDMRKGVLAQTLLDDPTIQWDVIFRMLSLRGRHRAKQRWRRAVIHDAIRRPFLRGGARRSKPAQPKSPPPAEPVVRPLKLAPWFIDVRELQSFAPLEVWDRFRVVFPVLAVYRSGWVASEAIATVTSELEPEVWSNVWREWRTTVDVIAATLQWPAAVLDVLNLLIPFAQRLWPDEPWAEWVDAHTVARAVVPYLRRVACLCYGFHLGGCSPRGVWEAIILPGRNA